MNKQLPDLEMNPNFRGILMGSGGSHEYQALDMTGLESPNVLFVSTPIEEQRAHDGWCRAEKILFEKTLGLDFSLLHPYLLDDSYPGANKPVDMEKMPSHDELEDKILAADLILVAGGNTRKMIEDAWIPAGIDKLFNEAIEEGVVVAGGSAGAIAWASGGHSDWQSYESNADFDVTIPTGQPDLEYGWNYDYVDGLGYLPSTVLIPHFDSRTDDGESRAASSIRMLEQRAKLGQVEYALGIDDSAALEVAGQGIVRALTGPKYRKQPFSFKAAPESSITVFNFIGTDSSGERRELQHRIRRTSDGYMRYEDFIKTN